MSDKILFKILRLLEEQRLDKKCKDCKYHYVDKDLPASFCHHDIEIKTLFLNDNIKYPACHLFKQKKIKKEPKNV